MKRIIRFSFAFIVIMMGGNLANANYDYTTGRWLQRDPIGYADGMNLYEYVKSQPTNKYDPYGFTFEFNVEWYRREERPLNNTIRGWVLNQFKKSSFECKKCVLHIDLVFDLSVHVLRVGHPMWTANQGAQYDNRWGPQPRTPNTERDACLAHETDHYQTYNVFWNRLVNGLSPYDLRSYSSNVMCERAKRLS